MAEHGVRAFKAGVLVIAECGKEEAFAVRATAPEGIPGPYEGKLEIEGDNGQRISLVLKAIFLGPDNSANNAMSQAATAPSAGAPNPDRLPSPGVDTPPDPGGLPEVASSDRQKALAAMAAHGANVVLMDVPIPSRSGIIWVLPTSVAVTPTSRR